MLGREGRQTSLHLHAAHHGLRRPHSASHETRHRRTHSVSRSWHPKSHHARYSTHPAHHGVHGRHTWLRWQRRWWLWGFDTPSFILIISIPARRERLLLLLHELLLLVGCHVFRRNTLHAVNLYLDIVTTRQRVRHLVHFLLVHLHAVYSKPRAGIHPLVTDVTLKMLGLLMLAQNLLIVELTVAVPAPGLHRLLLLATHCGERSEPYLRLDRPPILLPTTSLPTLKALPCGT